MIFYIYVENVEVCLYTFIINTYTSFQKLKKYHTNKKKITFPKKITKSCDLDGSTFCLTTHTHDPRLKHSACDKNISLLQFTFIICTKLLSIFFLRVYYINDVNFLFFYLFWCLNFNFVQLSI